jgi:hypothetical protein
MRLIAPVVFMVLGAIVALATEPLYPTDLKELVARGQVAVSGVAEPHGFVTSALTKTKPRWTVPTGLITVRDLAPRTSGGCILPDCPPNPLQSKATGKIKVSLQITPLAVAPDTDYAVVLSARDGHVYDSVRVSWTREDLIGIDPAERSVTKRNETAVLHNRRVDLEAPDDDVSVLPFIEDYNLVAGAAIKAYDEARAMDTAVDPLAGPIIAALFPGALPSPDEQEAGFDRTEMDRIVNEHFTLELVEARIFSARLRADPSESSRMGQLKP